MGYILGILGLILAPGVWSLGIYRGVCQGLVGSPPMEHGGCLFLSLFGVWVERAASEVIRSGSWVAEIPMTLTTEGNSVFIYIVIAEGVFGEM